MVWAEWRWASTEVVRAREATSCILQAPKRSVAFFTTPRRHRHKNKSSNFLSLHLPYKTPITPFWFLQTLSPSLKPTLWVRVFQKAFFLSKIFSDKQNQWLPEIEPRRSPDQIQPKAPKRSDTEASGSDLGAATPPRSVTPARRPEFGSALLIPLRRRRVPTTLPLGSFVAQRLRPIFPPHLSWFVTLYEALARAAP